MTPSRFFSGSHRDSDPDSAPEFVRIRDPEFRPEFSLEFLGKDLDRGPDRNPESSLEFSRNRTKLKEEEIIRDSEFEIQNKKTRTYPAG